MLGLRDARGDDDILALVGDKSISIIGNKFVKNQQRSSRRCGDGGGCRVVMIVMEDDDRPCVIVAIHG